MTAFKAAFIRQGRIGRLPMETFTSKPVS